MFAKKGNLRLVKYWGETKKTNPKHTPSVYIALVSKVVEGLEDLVHLGSPRQL